LKPGSFFAALGFLLTPASQAADLLDIYRDALTRDATFASARAARLASLEKLPQGRALLLPAVNLSASSAWNTRDFSYEIPPPNNKVNQEFNSNGYTLSLSQPLYRRQNWAMYESGKRQAAMADTQFSAAQQELILSVTQSYFDALLAQDNLSLAQSQKKAIQQQLEQAKANFDVGTATITDTHEAQARHDLAVATEIAASNEVEVKLRALEKIIAKRPDTLSSLLHELPLQQPEPADMNQWVTTAEQNNLSNQLKQAAVAIAQHELERVRGGHHPTIDLVASYSDNSQSGGALGPLGTYVANETKTSAIGVQLNLPVFQGGATSSQIREALANQEKSRQELEASVRLSALATREAYLGVTSGIAQVKALEQALVSSQSSLDSTQLGQEVGVRTNVDVLNAQQQLFSARRDLYKARYAYLTNRLRLKAATGSLNEQDLVAINGLLQNQGMK
jgi:outer membrane protein